MRVMTLEEKELVKCDLCARLPYGVICETYLGDRFVLKDTELSRENTDRRYFHTWCVNEIKPFLRPMSSMTDDERNELHEITHNGSEEWTFSHNAYVALDWLNARHFDYRHLIEKGLALEAPTDMYNNQKTKNV